MKKAEILYGSTDFGALGFSSDLLWKTGFKAPDPFLFFEIEGKTFLLLSSLEVGRGMKEARADEVISIEGYYEAGGRPGTACAAVRFLKEQNVEIAVIPENFPYAFGRVLAEAFSLEVKKAPFCPERARKTDQEIAEISKAHAAVEGAFGKARDFLKESRIENGKILCNGELVTSERVRRVIDSALYEKGYMGIDTIVSCGADAADPHAKGSGPLAPYVPIVMDVFPASLETHYFADATRTFFKGEPSPAFKKMYQTVLGAQALGIGMVRTGEDGARITRAVESFFVKSGYPTDRAAKPAYGFIHGLGHGVGIDIHEAPSIGRSPAALEERNVITIEPGLYYPQEQKNIPAGGIRVEDAVVVTKKGCRNLMEFPKELSDAIL